MKLMGFIGLSAFVVFMGAAPQKQECLHGSSETPPQAVRRQAALQLARQLNTTEAAAHRQAQSYYVLSDLHGIAPAPDGFHVQLSTDGASYAFSIKDTLDACGFAFFSDQDGVIFTGTPIR
jgi:hypothetical protein